MSEYAKNIQTIEDMWKKRIELPKLTEVVRCRDCKRSEETPDKWFCHRFSMFDNAGFPVEPDGFCAWGERREP